jgi:hypothetical protein
MWRETNVFGVFISPLIAYMLAALLAYLCLRPVLVRLGLQRCAWNVPLAETALYICILGALIAFL